MGSNMFEGFVEGFTKTLGAGIAEQEKQKLEAQREAARALREENLMRFKMENENKQAQLSREATAAQNKAVLGQADKHHQATMDYNEERDFLKEVNDQNQRADEYYFKKDENEKARLAAATEKKLDREATTKDKAADRASHVTVAQIGANATKANRAEEIQLRIEAAKTEKEQARLATFATVAAKAYDPLEQPEEYNAYFSMLVDHKMPAGYQPPEKERGFFGTLYDAVSGGKKNPTETKTPSMNEQPVASSPAPAMPPSMAATHGKPSRVDSSAVASKPVSTMSMSSPSVSQAVAINSQAEFDALPKGAKYIYKGKTAVKQ